LISSRFVLHLLLLGIIAGVSVAQDSSKQNSVNTPSSTKSAGEEKAEPSSSRVILKVGGVQITQADFEAMIGDIEPEGDPDKTPDADRNRRQLGDDFASVIMLSQQAEANHLDQSPEIRRQLAVGRMQILSDAQFASLMSQSKPSSEQINQYYSSHLADFDRVRVRRLFIWKTGAGSTNTKGLAPEAARTRANEILKAAVSGGDAEKLAEAIKDSGEGLLDAQPVTFFRGALSPNLEKVTFSLKPGEWAEGQDTPDRLMLLQLVEHDRRPLAEVSSVIEQRVQAEKMEMKLGELKKKAGIWMDQQYFGTAVATVPREQRPDNNPPSTIQKSARKTGDQQ